MTHDDFIMWRDLSVIPCIIAVLWSLFIVLAREQVKQDIVSRGFRPIRVRWTIFTWWPVYGPAYRVRYADAEGLIHEALYGVCNWRYVRWRDDRVIEVD